MRHYAVLYFLLTCGVTTGAAVPAGAAPVLRVVKAGGAGISLLRNGGFENGVEPEAWSQFESGFRVAPGEGRNGSRAVVCENHGTDGASGISQTVALDGTTATPIVVRGWSRAEGVSGSADGGYSIYVDLTYADGTPLWGQTSDFRTGTHDWQQREVMILPVKPIKSLNVYCLLRGHSGKVWFDDVSVEELKSDGRALLFQGVPVQPAPVRAVGATQSRTVGTRDGLQLRMSGQRVAATLLDGRPVPATAYGGFMARDVAANSDFAGFANGACPELDLKLDANLTARPEAIAVDGRVSSATHLDRAVTLTFALPVDAAGWHWGDDIRHGRVIEGNNEYSNAVAIKAGSTGTMSLYPVAAVWNDRVGLALALNSAQPAQYRVAYNAGTRQLLIAYDFGLVPETRQFPSGAKFSFVIYRFDPHWGLRAAYDKLSRIFPEQFEVRSHDQGIWMPFTDVSTVQGWPDFGFKYHEGDNNVAFDDAHNILSFRYTEPMTWWMPMKSDVPRTVADALRVRDALAAGTDAGQRRMAQVTKAAAMTDEDGQPAMIFRKEPWGDGAVWSLNPNPWLPTPANTYNEATVYWNDQIKARLYGAGAQAHLDGEYLDSIEGYVTTDLNYNRDQFQYSTVPLTFDHESKRPALYKGFAVYEFEKWLADDVHRMGKLMFANGLPYRYPFLCPPLDVMGTETDWLQGKQYHPASDEQMNLWRTSAFRKPYVLLMNTDFDTFDHAMVEKYFQRSLFYGMYPSMFSHNAAENPYWGNPKWYNRDRDLFQKYIPLIKRIAEAGWQPVTEAHCDNPHVYIERFGPDAAGHQYFTLLNDSDKPQGSNVHIAGKDFVPGRDLHLRELVSGHELGRLGHQSYTDLQPQQVLLLQVDK